MNGAESLVHTLIGSGIDTCFANPGTSEMHFVAALDRIPGIKCVLGLQENVVTGMADGYFRIAEKPASTLLHCGPGLANGLGNLHNTRRARSGVVNIVGDQATFHRPYDAPLTADTESLSRSVSSWVRTSLSAADVGRDAAQAVQVAASPPGQVATLILPSDVSWEEGGVVGEALPKQISAAVDAMLIEEAAKILRGPDPALILLSAGGVLSAGQQLAWDIAKETGADLMTDFAACRLSRGSGTLQLSRVPYNIDEACKSLSKYKHIILVSAKPPVGFFAYPGKPSKQYRSDVNLFTLSRPDQDACAALGSLAMELDAKHAPVPQSNSKIKASGGHVSSTGLAQTLALLMPESSIVVDESVSYGHGFYQYTHSAPAHDWLHNVGGAIGEGIPMATGAALAAKGKRRVINLQADGSAMYSLQALWTQARERLPCTTIILSNRKYDILVGEYEKVGARPGPTAMSMLDLTDPNLNWVQLANGMGVEAEVASNLDELGNLLSNSFSQSAPFLIELLI